MKKNIHYATIQSMNTTKVITRFAPSPTGYLHAGNYRTALFSYMYARQKGGKFILRIEDTDKERSKKEYEDNIIDSLKWLGLTYDDFCRQSDRTLLYGTYIQKLLDSGNAYISKEIPKEPGDRSEVIRFKNPNKKVKFTDLIRGDIEFDTTDLGDFVIARSMTEPVFHLVVVIDDALSEITHIIRGEDHISNTPRHILIYEALGLMAPHYAHIPLLLSPDRTKMSKRKGALPITEYRKMGYLPEAVINYLAFLGWNPGGERELYNVEELIKLFDLNQVQKSAAIFNIEKLNWFNKEYIKLLPQETLFKYVSETLAPHNYNSEILRKITPLIVERISRFGELEDMVKNNELQYFFNCPVIKKELLAWKTENDFQKIKERLITVSDILKTVPESDYTKDKIKEALWPFAEKEGRGAVLWPLRVSLSGQEKSPDPFTLIEIFGKEETIIRLENTIKLL
jgi:glutamyl-tRNA synthetase